MDRQIGFEKMMENDMHAHSSRPTSSIKADSRAATDQHVKITGFVYFSPFPCLLLFIWVIMSGCCSVRSSSGPTPIFRYSKSLAMVVYAGLPGGH